MRHGQKEIYTSYVIGRIQADIERFADSAQLPREEFTRSVATFLLSSTGGELLGGSNSMSPLRRQTASRSKTVAKMEMDGGPHSGTQKRGYKWTPAQRKAQSKRMKERWKVKKGA